MIDSAGRPAGLGPWRTSVAQALQNYARERLPSLDGAKQDVDSEDRIKPLPAFSDKPVTKSWPAFSNDPLLMP